MAFRSRTLAGAKNRAACAACMRILVEQERACWAFLTFELRETADNVCLLVTAPAAAVEAVPDLLYELTGRR